MARTRKRVIVDGVVQGVFFRDSTRREALIAGVDGWVRNLPDGRVEAVLEGEPDAVLTAVSWMRVGPPRAIVTAFQEFAEEPEGLRGFDVRG